MTSTDGPGGRPRRGDAQRNYDRLLAEARTAFAARGVDASLDDIAHSAGVGSGTLYRHFPTRTDLVEAVFAEAVGSLRARADRGMTYPDADVSLREWLVAFIQHVTLYRGVGAFLMESASDQGRFLGNCHNVIRDSLGDLLDLAQRSGAVRPGVAVMDLLKLANGIAVATERSPQDAGRLLDLVLDGIRSHCPPD